jgi:branched-chain amino acid transport system ATP-binding protein
MEPPVSRPSVLRYEDVSLRFGGVRALNGVSFDVRQGELFAIIGPNGAGKTSLFNCLNGVYRPQQGCIRVDGEDVTGRRDVAKLGVARTFQNLGLFAGLSVVDNILLGRHRLMNTGFLAASVWVGRARREEAEHRARVDEIVAMLGLEAYRDNAVSTLPYGIQKRVELARAVAMEPRVLLLDEPVAGMGYEETEDMAHHIRAIREQLDLAIVLVEHDMRFVMSLAERVLVLNFGEVIASGTPAEVQRDERVIAAYLGEPAS